MIFTAVEVKVVRIKHSVRAAVRIFKVLLLLLINFLDAFFHGEAMLTLKTEI